MDSVIVLLDKALKVLTHHQYSGFQDSFDQSIPLMKANYAGEVAAQGLYLGAWTFEKNPKLSEFYKHAIQEENIHLDWCGKRISELGGKASVLNPVWFIGAFCMGAASQIGGYQYALGFVHETEKQVLDHLESHLHRLPMDDHVSRNIVEKMVEDEKKHANEALALGGKALPKWVCATMSFYGKILTSFSERC